MRVAGFAVLLTSWLLHDSELLPVELWCGVQPSTLFTWPSTNKVLSISECEIEFQVKIPQCWELEEEGNLWIKYTSCVCVVAVSCN